MNCFSNISDFVCGYPLFILLIGGGLFLFIYSGALPLRRLGASIRVLRDRENSSRNGQISSFQALMATISSTVGMGNIAGVAIAICMGGPGAIFWMWVSALLGMATKFFEGTLAIMYRGKDGNGNLQGGPMYVITEGLGRKFKPLAVFFACFGLIGCFCVMQANQLTESITTVVTEPLGLGSGLAVKAVIGLVMLALVSAVVVGGIGRIAKVASRIVPIMVGLYLLLVFMVIVLNIGKLPMVFAVIFKSAFNFRAGFGALAGTAIIGARRAMYVNEAGVGTASLMHGSSRNDSPVREGLVAMLGPAIDSGLVCTLTAIPILMAGSIGADGNWSLAAADASNGIKGLAVAMGAYDNLLPGWGRYALLLVVTFFAFSTMFSYSVYGLKCANYLFGEKYGSWYRYIYLAIILVSCIVSLDTVVCVMDFAFAMMAVPTMSALLALAPKVRKAVKDYRF